MNGRILFSLLGFAMTCFASLYWKELRASVIMLYLSAGILTMSVSSGTIMVGAISVGTLSLYKAFSDHTKKDIFILLALLLLLLLYLAPLLDVLVMKNINYYGGIENMLDHGIGKILNNVSVEVLWMLVFNAAVLILLIMYIYRKYFLLLYFSIISIMVGLFGYSSLSMALIPLTILLSVFFLSFSKKKYLPANEFLC